MPGMLEQLRVIDMASFLAGPCAATILSDYGADVIKVEALAGDGQRGLSDTHPVDFAWQLTSRNKRSIALDFTTAEGHEVLLKMVAGADVLLSNLRADQLQRYQLTYETLKQVNPRLVFAQISGYGQRGPVADRRAFDLTGWFARSGFMDVTRHKDSPPPTPAGGVGDHATGMTLFGGIMLALFRREQTGEGSMVSTSLAAAGTWANGLAVAAMLAGRDPTERRDKEGHSNPFTNVYQTQDERFVMMALAQPWKEWPKLARALSRPEWIDDERFVDFRTAMVHRVALRAMIAERFAALPAAEAERLLDEQGLPFNIVARVAEVVDDAQLIANDVIVRTESSEPGYERTLATPFILDSEPQQTPRRAPTLGADTRTVMRELGYADGDVERLIASRVLGG